MTFASKYQTISVIIEFFANLFGKLRKQRTAPVKRRGRPPKKAGATVKKTAAKKK